MLRYALFLKESKVLLLTDEFDPSASHELHESFDGEISVIEVQFNIYQLIEMILILLFLSWKNFARMVYPF